MKLSLVTLFAVTILFVPSLSQAHCDTMDGPVIKAAQKALESADISPVLIWVKESDEAQIREAFSGTLAVRKLNDAARGLADRFFFETLVRIHRTGEGEPYTGIKPAGLDMGPAIPAADKAMETGSLKELHGLIVGTLEQNLHASFQKAYNARKFDPKDIQAGREFVEAYVPFLHYVEKVYDTAATPMHGHGGTGTGAESQHEGH